MKPGMRMLAATTARRGESGGRSNYSQPRRGGSGGRNEYEDESMRYEYTGSGMNYGGVEGRFRDRRGREHYDNGRFAPMRNDMDDMDEMEDNYGPENRRRYRRYSDGRFAPRSAYNDGRMGTEMHYPATPFVPPVYERWGGEQRMNPIGFTPTGYWDTQSNYGMYADHKTMDEMENRSGTMQRGGAFASGGKLTREMAEEWMRGLENEDGTKGPHWNLDQAKHAMKQRGIQEDPYEFWAVMNALYADYCKVFKNHGINNAEVYADLAAAWIGDKDAVPGKAAAYFQYLVK